MNTYDPAHFIRYVHLDGPAEAPPVVTRLPAGYADESPRTSLRRSGRAQRPGAHGIEFRREPAVQPASSGRKFPASALQGTGGALLLRHTGADHGSRP